MGGSRIAKDRGMKVKIGRPDEREKKKNKRKTRLGKRR